MSDTKKKRLLNTSDIQQLNILELNLLLEGEHPVDLEPGDVAVNAFDTDVGASLPILINGMNFTLSPEYSEYEVQVAKYKFKIADSDMEDEAAIQVALQQEKPDKQAFYDQALKQFVNRILLAGREDADSVYGALRKSYKAHLTTWLPELIKRKYADSEYQLKCDIESDYYNENGVISLQVKFSNLFLIDKEGNVVSTIPGTVNSRYQLAEDRLILEKIEFSNKKIRGFCLESDFDIANQKSMVSPPSDMFVTTLDRLLALKVEDNDEAEKYFQDLARNQFFDGGDSTGTDQIRKDFFRNETLNGLYGLGLGRFKQSNEVQNSEIPRQLTKLIGEKNQELLMDAHSQSPSVYIPTCVKTGIRVACDTEAPESQDNNMSIDVKVPDVRVIETFTDEEGLKRKACFERFFLRSLDDGEVKGCIPASSTVARFHAKRKDMRVGERVLSDRGGYEIVDLTTTNQHIHRMFQFEKIDEAEIKAFYCHPEEIIPSHIADPGIEALKKESYILLDYFVSIIKEEKRRVFDEWEVYQHNAIDAGDQRAVKAVAETMLHLNSVQRIADAAADTKHPYHRHLADNDRLVTASKQFLALKQAIDCLSNKRLQKSNRIIAFNYIFTKNKPLFMKGHSSVVEHAVKNIGQVLAGILTAGIYVAARAFYLKSKTGSYFGSFFTRRTQAGRRRIAGTVNGIISNPTRLTQ